jgi:hypothetical protein
MPNSPSVKFTIENNNIEQTTPQVGVSMVLARTKKGPFLDPSTVINTVSQFRNLFGGEVVPDGTPSNIEKALSLGSKLRIIRVPGSNYYKGSLVKDHDGYVLRYVGYTDNLEYVWFTDPDGKLTLNVDGTSTPCAYDTTNNRLYVDDESDERDGKYVDYDPTNHAFISNTSTNVTASPLGEINSPLPAISFVDDKGNYVKIGFFTKTYDETVDGSDTFQVDFVKKVNTLYCQIYGKGKSYPVASTPVVTLKNKTTTNSTSIDYLALGNFFKHSDYLEPVFLDSTFEGVTSLDSFLDYLSNSVDNSDTIMDIQFEGSSDTFNSSSFNKAVFTSIKGSSGSTPTVQQWKSALDLIKDYTEPYQFACSHLDQHLTSSSEILEVHKAAKEICEETQEYTYYIEVPKYTTHYTEGTQVRDKDSIISWINTCIGTIGNSKWVAYFAGGIKYYNDKGNLVNGDVLGTILGLGDYSAATYGPWRSFAGLNRGLIYDGNGPCSPNYGSPARYDDLNELAQNYANMIVVRNVGSGKSTMLWHCFTSQVKQDSFKYLSIVRLVLYMKKYFRPILESYLEEPNIWHTWSNIYLQVKPALDDMVNQDVISEYTWMGDQQATSYDDLVVNNEADVRQGKYKVILKFKDIVPIQEINLVLSIDKSSNTTSTEITSE